AMLGVGLRRAGQTEADVAVRLLRHQRQGGQEQGEQGQDEAAGQRGHGAVLFCGGCRGRDVLREQYIPPPREGETDGATGSLGGLVRTIFTVGRAGVQSGASRARLRLWTRTSTKRKRQGAFSADAATMLGLGGRVP